MPKPRKLPRPFEMHWGNGQIVEEAGFTSEHHEPAIQLLEYTDPDNAGGYSIRFCFYNLRGAFQRSPLMLGEGEMEGMREALQSTPRLRALLKRLVE